MKFIKKQHPATLHIEIQTGQTCLFVFLQADGHFLLSILPEKATHKLEEPTVWHQKLSL